MKVKLESDDGQSQLDRQWANEYGEKRNRSRRKQNIGLRVATEQNGKTSTYSSSSRLTSMIKGYSISENDYFKGSESVMMNQLTQKYVPRGTAPQKVKQQMQLVLQRKKSEIQALRVHRDELKFISYNNPYDMPIKISLAVLKEKARAQQKIRDMMLLLQRDIRELQFQITTMTDYYTYIQNAVKVNGEEDLIIDTQEEQQLMIQNLEKETNHLFRELKEEDKKNAKEIKSMSEEIGLLRVYIKQKEDTIRDLKSKICTLHIKLHSRTGSTSKEKSLSLSVRKFITEQDNSIQQAFIGNSSFKNYGKQLLEKVSGEQQLIKIIFFFEPKKELITFQCIYKNIEGKLHSFAVEETNNNHVNLGSPRLAKSKKEPQSITVKVKYLLSIKFFFKSKVVGLECRVKTNKGTQLQKIGNCQNNLQHELLTLINKKVVTLGSYWHNKDLIGVGIWFSGKWRKGTSRQKQRQQLLGRLSPRAIKTQQFKKREENNDYYQI